VAALGGLALPGGIGDGAQRSLLSAGSDRGGKRRVFFIVSYGIPDNR
jgi:hypothetical protein